MDRVSRAFFDLPLADKQRVARPKPEQSRGYIGVGEENLAYGVGTATTDLKEFFAIGPVDVPDAPYYTAAAAYPSFAPNVWPEEPAELRDVYTAYYHAMERLATALMRAFALALDLRERFFADKIDRHISGIRVINYPDQPVAPPAGQLRAGAHSDYGALTILKSENVPGGLQVLNRAGDWVDVEPPAGAFVVNIGDLMMHWTNDRWVSTLHRVVNPPRGCGAGQPPPVDRLLLSTQLRRADRVPALVHRPRPPAPLRAGDVRRAPPAQVPPDRLGHAGARRHLAERVEGARGA